MSMRGTDLSLLAVGAVRGQRLRSTLTIVGVAVGILAVVLLTALGPMLGPVIRGMTPGLWGLLGFQAIGVVCIGFLGWLMVLKVYPASDVASFGFLAPLCGVTFGWLILDEPVTWTLLVALVLVGIGIVLVNRR